MSSRKRQKKTSSPKKDHDHGIRPFSSPPVSTVAFPLCSVLPTDVVRLIFGLLDRKALIRSFTVSKLWNTYSWNAYKQLDRLATRKKLLYEVTGYQFPKDFWALWELCVKLDPEKPCGVVTKTGGRFYLDGAYNFIAKTDAAIDADLEKIAKEGDSARDALLLNEVIYYYDVHMAPNMIRIGVYESSNVRVAYYFEQNKFDCGKKTPQEQNLNVSPFVVTFHNDGMEFHACGDTIFNLIKEEWEESDGQVDLDEENNARQPFHALLTEYCSEERLTRWKNAIEPAKKQGPFYANSTNFNANRLLQSKLSSAFHGACVGRKSANHFDPSLIKRLHSPDPTDADASEAEKVFTHAALLRNRTNTLRVADEVLASDAPKKFTLSTLWFGTVLWNCGYAFRLKAEQLLAASYEALGRKTLARILRVRCHYLHKQPSWNEWSPSVDAFGASEAQVEALLQQKLLAPTISVNYSTIRSIPTSITSSMKHLTSLQITDALLTDFSLVCENLLSLTALTLSGNTIREIPSSITRLTNLRELSLVDNSIAHIPEGFSKLEALHTLQMAENCLEEISKELLNCSRLTKLMLSCNRIKVIPSAINKLKALKELDLANNRITKVPISLRPLLDGGTQVNLLRNRLVEFAPNLRTHQSLVIEVYLRANIARK